MGTKLSENEVVTFTSSALRAEDAAEEIFSKRLAWEKEHGVDLKLVNNSNWLTPVPGKGFSARYRQIRRP